MISLRVKGYIDLKKASVCIGSVYIQHSQTSRTHYDPL